ncbi:hypothetical protein Nepgr_003781 [Nepenthes gracilis]|uniref:non-specific serine/threonine protein kinase n=1 Tax=Nepenthes gracilis TaxID=150966 RepID=A0AAD3S083_NEPGR|nr:hypothetical protein Nepgr_003781 [Nepenthes gracilis]
MGCSSNIKWRHHTHKPLTPIHFFTVFCLHCIFSFASESDKLALIEFKNSVSDLSGVLSSWNFSDYDHCSWFGVLCGSNSRVLALNITGGGNQNTFPCSKIDQFPLFGYGIRRKCAEGNGVLAGKLPLAISKLTELRVLSLPFNEFSGEIPSEIWRMQSLEVLDLEGNLINGSLPVWFSGLRNLQVLNLGFNMIEGELPNSLSNCAVLEVLNLSGNRLNGTVPGFVGRKRIVSLSFNMLHGTIPSAIGSNCQKLEFLDLSANSLSHGIPSSLGNCSQLLLLLLHSNMLEDAIPAELGQLKKLQVLDVSRNSLSGLIPSQLGKCSELSVLVLSNTFNPLPTTGRYASDASGYGSDDYNYFEGGLPAVVAALPNLKILWAPRATLEGMLPRTWGSCISLEMLNLAENFFTGEIPDGFASCKKLHFLDLSSNRLNGELNDKLPVPCMTLFDVSGNLLTGPIPRFYNSTCELRPLVSGYAYGPNDPSHAYLSFFASKALGGEPFSLINRNSDIAVMHNFGSNNFTGTLHTFPIASDRLGKQIIYAYLAAKNGLSGSFPGSLFDNCDKLGAIIVNVSSNNISGRLSASIGSICKSLVLLDASENLINGSIPLGLGALESLVALDLSKNMLQGQIPVSIGQISGLRFLSLADNDLTGNIPSSLGQLRSLEVLDLSSNGLSGGIPKNFENLRNLSVLLLTNNKLSGQIPSGLANMKTLSAFNVSFNNLSGPLASNRNLIKCSSVLGNPLLGYCPMFSLTVSPSAQQGANGDMQNYAASPSESQAESTRSSGFTSIEIAAVTSASAIFSVLVALIVLFIYTRRCNRKSRILASVRKEVTIFAEIGVPLTFDIVVRATGNFSMSNCIGNGGFGATYKAEISPGVLVAVKRLAVGRFQGIQQYHVEIKTLGRLRHPNLVTLIGYHASEMEMFLIYNYLPGGNLEKFIQERSTRAVDWRILHKIALDIARALAYLHDQCVPRVLHRDVKPSNILLDDDYNAYLSDFGLARLLGTSETHATTGVAGTFGYVAPEYAMTCRVSDKADVYSYGVVLLELLSDKKALDPSFSPYGNGFNIVAWACMLLRQGRAKEFFVTGLWDNGPHDDLVEVLHLAVVCTVDSLSTRPTMRHVLRRLKELQPPSC